MANIVREDKYIMSDIGNNNNKYWYIRLYDDNQVITENGRVGSTPQIHPKSFSSQSAAESFYDTKIREKEKKGYSKLKVLSGSAPAQVTVSGGNLTEVALRQIASKSSKTAKLIKYLSTKNIHNILSATTMQYDESKGTFSTPCGIVTTEGIDEARALLAELSTFIDAKDFKKSEFIQNLQKYIQLIPRKAARKLVADEVIPDRESVEKEYQVLDALSASLQQVMSANDSEDKTEKVDEPKVFSVKLDVVDDQKVIDHINKFYNSTRNRSHTSYNLKIKKVYSVEIEGMHKAFKNRGEKIGNIMELWHGTRVENVLSILKGGLIIPKSNARHVTGRMFGDGVYFSDQSTKSLNYSQGYWGHGSKDNNCFMFIADVAMGKEYVPSGPSQNLPKPGYDSTFAKAHKSGVINNEMIVYNLYQCNLKYLVEFSD